MIRWLARRRATIGFLVLAAGTIAGHVRLQAEIEQRCEATERAFVLLGEELEAPQERVDRFLPRLRDVTDC
jgi:hypothetical protein